VTMELSSVRELKALLTETVLASLKEPAGGVRNLDLPAGPLAKTAGPLRTMALGVASQGAGNFRLAVRFQRPELGASRELELIRKKAKGEVDIRYIGRLTKMADRVWQRRRIRPLQLGSSIGHYQITAGTLGAVIRRKKEGTTLLLSNNHVLANENKGKLGDPILQPGAYDEGKNPDDAVATLFAMARLKKTGANEVDCAVAAPKVGIEADACNLRGLGKLAGVGSEFLDGGAGVAKLGRTTGLTRGSVTAFELDNVIVAFDIGSLRFDNQIEVEGEGENAFSAGGDSGSLILNEDRLAVALLFAGGDTGGTNGKGLTYANPIRVVLDALGAELVT
jgi:hypothetical protein